MVSGATTQICSMPFMLLLWSKMAGYHVHVLSEV